LENITRRSKEEVVTELKDALNDLSILNRSYVASRQNNIINTHLRIANSSNPEVIKMFLATDSPGKFKDLANQVDKVRRERGIVAPISTILSETYQRTKYINATAGKNAVGKFSLDSTFNATAQGKDLVIINLSEENHSNVYGTLENPIMPTKESILEFNTPLATFGEVVSRGDLSNKYTLRSQAIINNAKKEKRDLTEEEKKSLKYKSEVIRTLQSSALDNEKEQILDKLNINDNTFAAIRALSLLGFEEEDIAGLLSQEIIWEYVEALQDANSSLTNYNPNAAEDITRLLVLKYDKEDKFTKLSKEDLAKYQSQSGQELLDNIANNKLAIIDSGKTPDFNLQQLALLEKFKELTDFGQTINELQSTINTESKGLPKSLLEINTKKLQISKLPSINVFNATKLLGDYAGNELLRPTGINGYAAYYGTLFADQIFNEYFPYKTQGFQSAVSEILSHTPKGANISLSKKAEIEYDIFNDIKSYLYGNPDTNLFSGDPTLERKRLFIDSKNNQSLATILNKLQDNVWFKKNNFLNKLDFDLNKNGQVSRINFEAAAGENFDERPIYDGFVYLLTKNFPVGTFNGKEYTSRTLAQDLIAAAFLEGGTQGAKQYLKYVPLSYLKVLGFGDYLGNIPFDFVDTFYGNVTDKGVIYNQPSSFARQYFQNNPDKTKTVSLSDLKGNIVAVPEGYFTLNEPALANNFIDIVDPHTGDSVKTQTQFLSIYDTKQPSKYALFEFDSVDRVYKRIPVLSGKYGFVSYNSTAAQAIPIESGEVKTNQPINVAAPGYNIQNVPVVPTKEFNINVVNNTAEVELTAGMPISKALNNSKEALDDLINNLETAEGVSTLNKQLMTLFRELELPKGFTVKYVTNGKGQYDYNNNSLLLNLNHRDHTTANGLATTVLHELTHAFTGEAIKKYERGDTDLSPSQIAAIKKLEALQALYIANLTEQGEAGSLAAFKAKYEEYAASDKTKPSGLTSTEISKYYGAIKLSEFVTMALTDVEFQKRLNDIKTEDGKTLWQQIKDALLGLLNSLGLDIQPGSALASGVKSTFDLIEANQAALKENNITTKEFVEFGTKYRFQVNGNNQVIKAEYAQGGSNIYNSMNPKNAQKKYDSLNAGIITQPPTQPSTVNNLSENIKNFVNSIIPNWINNKNNELQLVSEFKTIQLLTQEESSIEDRISFGEEAEKLIKQGLKGKNVFEGTTFEEQIPNLLYAVISGKLAKDGILEVDMYSNIFKSTTQPSAQPTVQPTKGKIDEKYQLFPGVYANQGQREAIDLLEEFLGSNKKEFLLQGKGGTGKTTIIKKIIADAKKKGMEILGVAPTHKAKKVLGKSITNVKTTTLASALAIKLDESTGNFTPDEYLRSRGKIPIKGKDLIIIDESSMISDKLLEELRTFVDKGAKIIFMGDRAQLPPVGQESDSRVFRVDNGYELTEKMRQAATSPIINIGSKVAANVETTGERVANPIVQSDRVDQTDPISGSSVIWENNESAAIDAFVKDLKQANGDVNYAKIVTFNNQNHNNSQSVKNLNRKVRQKLFGANATTEFVPGEILTAYETFGSEPPLFFNSEDLVVKSAVNLGPKKYVVSVNSANRGLRSIEVIFDTTQLELIDEDGKVLPETVPVISNTSKQAFENTMSKLFKTDPQLAYALRAKFANLEYGYAITSHKAQGSTYTNVYVMEDNIMGSSNGGTTKAKNQSLYVAVSRPTTKLVMVSGKNSGTTGAPLNLSLLGNLSEYQNMPIDTEYESKGPSFDDLEAYNKFMSEDQSLESSPIKPSEFEKYSLLCGK
jgi:nucleoside-triphosphatase THEP1